MTAFDPTTATALTSEPAAVATLISEPAVKATMAASDPAAATSNSAAAASHPVDSPPAYLPGSMRHGINSTVRIGYMPSVPLVRTIWRTWEDFG
ncbi:hypothetical protein E2562_023275 [Oryza meyeriana var. granulata]|uniref:Uncharacterized protein n=1 Tax=Oryza meyeriana var. granulata TaxID=110450 RepID=A0A6G1DL23_9ORYZ|nr:hypothetical protein E2562_023275 [Oryza meyeriana var. granulata]